MEQTQTKPGRGGKREGAGRKPNKAPIEKQRGVVIIAVGNPMYGKMAANLAASIRFTDKTVKIHLVHTTESISHLTPEHLKLFTSTAECPPALLQKNGKFNPVKPKACIYELSPFDETLMVDADVLWFGGKSPAKLMEELSALDFAAQSRGVTDLKTGVESGKYTHWCDVKEAVTAYGLTGRFYKLSSEIIWFRKTKDTKKMFGLVKRIFENPKVKPSIQFAGDVPDELAYNIATNLCGVKPRKQQDVFLYWDYMDDSRQPWTDVIAQYYGYSIGGNNIQDSTITRYLQMAKAHANALQLPYHFKIYPKRSWDNTRKHL